MLNGRSKSSCELEDRALAKKRVAVACRCRRLKASRSGADLIARCHRCCLALGLKTQAESNAVAAFEEDAQQISETVDARMRCALQVALQSCVALFAASDVVTREDWRRLSMDSSRSAIIRALVLGFAKHLRDFSSPRYERDMRTQGLFLDLSCFGRKAAAGNIWWYTFIEALQRADLSLCWVTDAYVGGSRQQECRWSGRAIMGRVSLSSRWGVVEDASSYSHMTIPLSAPVYSGREIVDFALMMKAGLSVMFYAALSCATT